MNIEKNIIDINTINTKIKNCNSNNNNKIEFSLKENEINVFF